MIQQRNRDELMVYCLNYIEGQGDFHPPLFPTMREMAEVMGIASTSTVLYHVNKLIKNGYITAVNRDGSKSRSFGFTTKGMKYAEGVRNESVDRGFDTDSPGPANGGVDSLRSKQAKTQKYSPA